MANTRSLYVIGWLLVLCCKSVIDCASDPVRFLVIGDWGVDGEEQRAHQINVANTMATYANSNPVQFVVSTGDNFYPAGVESADDDQFDYKWREVYNQPSIAKLPWYITLGNHDHGRSDDGREWYQVEFGVNEPRWILQNMSYAIRRHYSDFDIHLVLMDTQSLRHDKNDPGSIVGFAESEFSQSNATWKVAAYHHPAYSCGRYSGSGTIRSYVLPILESNGVDLVLNGHDHTLQHLTKDGSTLDYVISGAGGKLYDCRQENCDVIAVDGVVSQFCEATYGFVAVTVDKGAMTCEIIDENSNVIYSFRKNKV